MTLIDKLEEVRLEREAREAKRVEQQRCREQAEFEAHVAEAMAALDEKLIKAAHGGRGPEVLVLDPY